MPSLRARLVNFALPLLGIKRFFAQPDRLEQRIARLRTRKPIRPRAKWRRRFEIVESAACGFPVVTVLPRGGAKPGAPHLFYLHGGGYVMDIAAVHWDTVLRLCLDLGASATVPLYPLAPEHKASGVLGAIEALYDDLADRYGVAAITVMGDSAGGGMSLALVQILRDRGKVLPNSVVLYSPWLDATVSGEGQAAIEPRDRMLAIEGLRACGRLYAGDLPLDDPRVSPLFGEMEGLPPMAIFAGSSDILCIDARRLAARLEGDAIPRHIYREYADMGHVWMLLPIPEGRRALDQTGTFIRQQCEAT